MVCLIIKTFGLFLRTQFRKPDTIIDMYPISRIRECMERYSIQVNCPSQTILKIYNENVKQDNPHTPDEWISFFEKFNVIILNTNGRLEDRYRFQPSEYIEVIDIDINDIDNDIDLNLFKDNIKNNIDIPGLQYFVDDDPNTLNTQPESLTVENDELELFECPWCRHTVHICKDNDMYNISCENDKCPVKPKTPFTESREDLVRIWNEWKI